MTKSCMDAQNNLSSKVARPYRFVLRAGGITLSVLIIGLVLHQTTLAMHDPGTIAWLMTVICFGGIMQSTIGFAYALFSTPLLVLIGIPLPATIVIVATCSLVQSSIGAFHLRNQLPWRTAGVALVVRLVATAIGIVFLKRLATLPMDDVRLFVGLILCILVMGQWLIRVKPADRLHPAWGALAFTSSGLLAGLVGMGGPPLVLWAMNHNWSSEKTRAFLFSVFMISIPAQLAMLVFTFGPAVISDIGTGLLLSPVVFMGSLIGMPVGNRLSRVTMRNVAYGILLVLGLSTVIPRLLSVLRP